jgi:hypothetical protein
VTDTTNNLIHRLAKAHRVAENPRPRRREYVMETTTRLVALEKGRDIATPSMGVELRLKNTVVQKTVVLGRFESPEQAVLFGLTGQLRYGRIPYTEILELAAKGHAGFFRRQLNDTEIQHLLSVNSLTFAINRTTNHVSIGRVDDEFAIEVEVVA